MVNLCKPTPPRTWVHPSLFVFVILSLFLLESCATLPRIEDLYGPNLKPPVIIGPKGQLTPDQSKALIEELEKHVGPTDILEKHIALIGSISGIPLITGNRVSLLIDGEDTYPAMLNAIQNAKDHINFETYIFEDDEVGRRFSDALLQKRAEGVQVNLVYDSVGCLNTPAAFFQRLHDGGVQLLEYNPLNPLKAGKKSLLIQRDHRKILIVDGTVAFTGSVNISHVHSKTLSGSSSGGVPQMSWRDSHIQIEGPAVAEFQKLFLDTWTRQKGPELSKKNYFPTLSHRGDALARVIGSTPGQENRITYLMYLSAFTHARRSIHMTNSYFVPDHETVEALAEASRRGVDVKLVLPGTSDEELTFYAGRSHYEDLLEAGVKLYERQDAMLHSKTAVIDGIWSTVGSTNMDLWSFLRNDEVNAVILSQDFANKMESMFQKDIEGSRHIDRREWKKRPLGERVKEWLSRLMAHWL